MVCFVFFLFFNEEILNVGVVWRQGVEVKLLFVLFFSFKRFDFFVIGLLVLIIVIFVEVQFFVLNILFFVIYIVILGSLYYYCFYIIVWKFKFKVEKVFVLGFRVEI